MHKCKITSIDANHVVTDNITAWKLLDQHVDLYRMTVVSGVFPSELKKAVNLSVSARGTAMAACETSHLKSIYVTHLSSPPDRPCKICRTTGFFSCASFALNKLT